MKVPYGLCLEGYLFGSYSRGKTLHLVVVGEQNALCGRGVYGTDEFAWGNLCRFCDHAWSTLDREKTGPHRSTFGALLTDFLIHEDRVVFGIDVGMGGPEYSADILWPNWRDTPEG